MGLCLGTAHKPHLWSDHLEKMRNANPSTKDGIEPVRLGAFAPPGSALDRHSLVFFSEYEQSE
jgi:hypothetical protein